MVRWILKCSAIGSSSLSHLQKSKNFSKRHFPDIVLPRIRCYRPKKEWQGDFLIMRVIGTKKARIATSDTAEYIN